MSDTTLNPVITTAVSEVKLDRDGNIDLTQYSETQLSKYKGISTQLDLKDPNSILNFGADTQNQMSRYSDNFLTQVRTFDSGEVGGAINDLLTELNYIDVDQLEQSALKRILSKIPIVNKLIMSVQKIYQQYDKVSNNVQKICDKVSLGRINSLKDNAALENLFTKNVEFIKNMEELIIAGQLRFNDLQTELTQMEANAAQYNDYELADRKEYLHRLDKRLADMKIVRFIMFQSLSQIRIVQNNNASIAEKAQSILTTTIPVWKNQLTLAVALQRQKANIEVQQKVSDATNTILLKNAELLKTNSIAVAKAGEDTVVKLETLKRTTQSLIETVSEIKRIHEEGTNQRKSLNKDLESLETEIKKTVTGVTNRAIN